MAQTIKEAPRFTSPPANTPSTEVMKFSSTAGLICGFFWELWNSQSLAHWVYTVPFVHDFKMFEMPILGYAGYLPFGLECVVVASLLPRRKPKTGLVA